ncbi:hypothetical protein EMIHUDRAFT_72001, partial [Emiliania huxleyi CCMP1516]|uniref:Ubiquitin-like domain-containing protein n=2 Tax=Emiliania huxleyi TaxID=2903 RepID=A0A0D3K9W5_EMIH1
MELCAVLAEPEEASAPVQIFVKTLQGQTVTLDVSLDASVAAVYQALQDKQCLPACQLRLIFSSKEMNPARLTLTLRWYGVTRESTLHVLLRL